MTYSDCYKEIIKKYSENPSEPREWVIWLAFVILGSVILAIVLGCSDGRPTPWRAITCWEMIAIANTAFFSIVYFIDLWKEADPEDTRLQGIRGAVVIVVLLALNLLFLGCAFVKLHSYDKLHHQIAVEHQQEKVDAGNQQGNADNKHQERKVDGGSLVWAFAIYLVFVLLSFLVFAILDFLFANQSRVFRKVREYWLLCLFVDGPAVVAFLIMLVYLLILNAWGRTVNTDILSGAVVMQMLIADTLYLVVASNLYHNLLANKLCDGVTQVGDPNA